MKNRFGRLETALFFVLFTAFGLSAAAQTDAEKPMTAKSLTALIVEFKEIVSKNARDKNDTNLIGAKWDKRKDLAGKSKADVIQLLYDDVKSVIKDSGVQYQIYSIFAFYKRIPDDFQSEKSALSKPAAVEKLIELTLAAHPSFGFKDKLNKTWQNDLKSEQIEIFDTVLKENKQLTAKQKVFVKANYKRLGVIVDQKSREIVTANYKIEDWIKESLAQSFTDKFTVEELNELVNFFQETDGQSVLKFFKAVVLSKDGKPLKMEAEQNALENFKQIASGEKFMTAFFKETDAYIEPKFQAASAKQSEEMFALLDTANLNKIINQFVAKNYKK